MARNPKSKKAQAAEIENEVVSEEVQDESTVTDAAEATVEKATQGDTGKVIVIDRERYKYPRHEEKTASGRKAVDNDDITAKAMRGLSLEEVYAVAAENDIKPDAKLEARNPGLRRMAIGNMIRTKLRHQGFIMVKGAKHEDPNWTPPEPKPAKAKKEAPAPEAPAGESEAA